MTLRRRLLLVFGVFLLLLAANAAQAWLNLGDRDQAHTEISRFEAARETLAQLLAASMEQQAALRGFLISGDEEFLVPYELGRAAAQHHRSELAESLAGDDGLLRSLQAQARAEERWRAEVAEPKILAVREGRRADAEALLASGRSAELFGELRDELQSLRVATLARQLGAERRLEQVRERLEALVVRTFVAGLLVVALSAWLLGRWVTRPLEEIAAATRAVAEGDLEREVPAAGPPDVAALGRDAERMRERIVDELTRTLRAREALTQHGPAVVALRAQLEPRAEELPQGAAFAGLLEPGRGELAGDWYDAPRLSAQRIGVVVGDVSGQGAAAGVLAVRVKQLLLAALRDGRDPGEALGWAARHLGDTGERFATAFVAVVDTGSWTCRWANAGHPPAILTGPDDDAVTLLDPTGPLLGPLPGTWDSVEATVSPGAIVVVCTDGLLEARDGQRREFGFERLADTVARHRDEGPAAVVAASVSAARGFAGDSLDDDLTVVALGRAPVEGTVAEDQFSSEPSAQ